MRIQLGPEDRVQFEVLQWLKAKHSEVRKATIKIDNEGNRSVQGHEKARVLGLYKGASDLFIAWPCNGHHGLWLEIKREGYKIKPNNPHIIRQLRFIEHITSLGYVGAIGIGVKNCKTIITNYLKE